MGAVLTPPPGIQELNRASRSFGPSRGTLRPREVQESAQGHTASQEQKCRRRSWGTGLGVDLCPRSGGAGGSLRTMAAGRGGPPRPWGQQDSRCPQPRGAAVAAEATGLALSWKLDPSRGRGGLTGVGALQLCQGKVTTEGSQAKAEPDTYGDPGPTRARSSCAADLLVTGRSAPGCVSLPTLTPSCLRSVWRVGQRMLLRRAQQPRLLLSCPRQSDLELQL